MNNSIITLISDFGDKFAQAQIELVIHAINPRAKLVVGENNICPFSIIEGAFLLSNLYTYSPPGSIHIAVVDPGVGSDRKGLVIRTKNHWFVGPNNGLLYPAAQKDRIESAYIINEKKIGSLSNTFHGRDIFAKIAALLSLGTDPKSFCIKIKKSELCSLKFKDNQVLHIDPYGNLKLSTKTKKFQIGDKVKIRHKRQEFVVPYCRTFADVLPRQYLLYAGSHQTVELAINLASASKALNARVGDILDLEIIYQS